MRHANQRNGDGEEHTNRGNNEAVRQQVTEIRETTATERGNATNDDNNDNTNDNPSRNRPERQSNEGSQSTH